jgi:hypothetical protein
MATKMKLPGLVVCPLTAFTFDLKVKAQAFDDHLRTTDLA